MQSIFCAIDSGGSLEKKSIFSTIVSVVTTVLYFLDILK